MAEITGNPYGETIIGTDDDDIIDPKGGDDIVDGKGGVDTVIISEPFSQFTITTLNGITKIDGKPSAGTYA